LALPQPRLEPKAGLARLRLLHTNGRTGQNKARLFKFCHPLVGSEPLYKPTLPATSLYFKPFAILAAMTISVTSLRFMMFFL
jgi:hypothetical protein